MNRFLRSTLRAGIAAAGVALVVSTGIRVHAAPGTQETVASDAASSCPGGFLAGDVFAGNGEPGQIVRKTDSGATFISPWVVLPDATTSVTAAVRDRSCAFGGDLIMVTGGAAPSVWRVTSVGASTLIVALNTPVAGLATVPNDAVKYGPMAGRILTAGADRIFAIDAAGEMFTIGPDGDYPTTMPLAVEQLEEQTDSSSYCGQVFVRQPPPDPETPDPAAPPAEGADVATSPADETAGLAVMTWNGSAFDVSVVGNAELCR